MMDLRTRMEILPCGKCEDMMDCDLCIFQKEAKELCQQIRADAIDECIKKLAESEDTILSDKQYYTLMELKEQKK